MPASLPRLVLPVALFVATAAMLSGCGPLTTGTPASPSGSASVTATPSTSSTPTPTPTVSLAHPIAQSCTQLISPDTIYAFNPNLGPVAWSPAPGTDAGNAVLAHGVACRWQNQTSGDTIDISVASLDEAKLTQLKDAAFAAGGTMVPTYGEEAYFGTSGAVGTATVFDRSYWVVATSVYFAEPGDAADLIDSVLAALPTP